jgi:hypothetical protein
MATLLGLNFLLLSLSQFRGIVRGRPAGLRLTVYGLAITGSSRAKRVEVRRSPGRERWDRKVVGFFETFGLSDRRC